MVDEDGYQRDVVEVIENTKESLADFGERGYGQREYVITKENIQSLLDGKALAVCDGEYTNIFLLEDETE